jgi:hypothetical protein
MDPMSALAMMNPFNSLNPMNFLNPNSNPYLGQEFPAKQVPPEPLPVQVIEAPPPAHYRRSTPFNILNFLLTQFKEKRKKRRRSRPRERQQPQIIMMQ